MANIIAIPAFKDNYIWAIHSLEGSNLIVVDPGSADPVLEYLHSNNLNLQSILITHHHWDHTGGILALKKHYPHIQVYGPLKEKIDGLTHPLQENQKLSFPSFDMTLTVMDIPGHTLGHIAYFSSNHLFCGDTLFSCGCGKIFEGTPAQMANSLEKIKKLSVNTQIYCGHEYTFSNIAFAQKVEPNNLALKARLNEVLKFQQQKLPTLPVSLESELRTNPFLRCQEKEVIQSVQDYWGISLCSPLDIFAKLREWKNQF
ncbi:MAG: hydroxyacylglutathione hydrolase [Proteobacteria bacterium]|nr:hydroxyacylglutathione hydrolase [Pseudomonadota bacterium]